MTQDPSLVSNADPTPQATILGETARGVISLLLVIHLFMLAVGVLSNRVPSQIESDLRTVPRPYLQMLCMDLSYSFHLTHAQLEDTDHFFEVDLTLADGSQKRVLVPPPGMWPPVRFRRFERLAGTAALLNGNSSVEAIIPQAVAARLVREYGATGGVIRCRRHLAQAMQAVSSRDAKERDPYSENHYATVFESRILVVGGEVQLLKIEAARESAPAAQQP
jgi:hypothetical protein